MANLIDVKTPQGIVKVQIQGEEPSEEEQQGIYNTFFC